MKNLGIRVENFDTTPTDNGKIVNIASYIPGKVTITTDVYLGSQPVQVTQLGSTPDSKSTTVTKSAVTIQRVELEIGTDELQSETIATLLKNTATDLKQTYTAAQNFKTQLGSLPQSF